MKFCPCGIESYLINVTKHYLEPGGGDIVVRQELWHDEDERCPFNFKTIGGNK